MEEERKEVSGTVTDLLSMLRLTFNMVHERVTSLAEEKQELVAQEVIEILKGELCKWIREEDHGTSATPAEDHGGSASSSTSD